MSTRTRKLLEIDESFYSGSAVYKQLLYYRKVIGLSEPSSIKNDKHAIELFHELQTTKPDWKMGLWFWKEPRRVKRERSSYKKALSKWTERPEPSRGTDWLFNATAAQRARRPIPPPRIVINHVQMPRPEEDI